MTRSRGWNGAPPASDVEAAARILAVARDEIDRHDADISISAIARSLGVTRATVYRYFPSVDAVLFAAAREAAGGFLDRLENRLSGVIDPVDAVVEIIATILETLPSDKYMSIVFTPDRASDAHSGVTSPVAIGIGQTMLRRLDVDWVAHGYDDESQRDLAEFILRIIQTFNIDPGHPPRYGAHLRRYLRRWVGPAITHANESTVAGSE